MFQFPTDAAPVSLETIPTILVFAPGDYIPGFEVFVQYRGSNDTNNDHFMRMFPPMFSI